METIKKNKNKRREEIVHDSLERIERRKECSNRGGGKKKKGLRKKRVCHFRE